MTGDSEPCAEVDDEGKMTRSSSTSSNNDSLVEGETNDRVVLNKAVQVKPLMESQKSLAKFGVCIKLNVLTGKLRSGC